MIRLRIRRTVLGVGALLLVGTAVAACGTAAADVRPTPTVPAVTSAPRSEPTTMTTSTQPGTTAAAPKTTTAPPRTVGTARSVGRGAPPAAIYTCDGHAVARPSLLIVTCADAGMVLVHLHWTDWGEASAYATGTLQEERCIPSCASSDIIDTYRASVTVSGLAQGHYRRIQIIAPHAPGQPYDVPLPTGA
jgi:hypothetical protein